MRGRPYHTRPMGHQAMSRVERGHTDNHWTRGTAAPRYVLSPSGGTWRSSGEGSGHNALRSRPACLSWRPGFTAGIYPRATLA